MPTPEQFLEQLFIQVQSGSLDYQCQHTVTIP